MAGHGKRHAAGSLRNLFAGIAETAACVRFFSRLPVPALGPQDDPAALPDFTTIARMIPLAGLIVALPAAAAGVLLGSTALPALAVGFIVVALLAAVTGALHEDGLSDVADGFFGGHTRERRLEIMKDSRIGAFGALALVLSTGLKASLIAGLLDRLGALNAMAIVLGAESFGRTLIVWQWTVLPPARPEGLGSRFGTPDKSVAMQGALIGLLCLLVTVAALSLMSLALALFLAGITAYLVGLLARAKVGGFTGDVLGAIQQLSSLAFLMGALAIH
ncbi:adenosylcobinamide-GDP ribazoletransferase [Roseibium sp.]|uniref:adenosylcobinamide-GDP ribazoletransferase n=1 Tax=Roseibium sp. TaxID=1936156 RepID=UPI003A97D8DE